MPRNIRCSHCYRWLYRCAEENNWKSFCHAVDSSKRVRQTEREREGERNRKSSGEFSRPGIKYEFVILEARRAKKQVEQICVCDGIHVLYARQWSISNSDGESSVPSEWVRSSR